MLVRRHSAGAFVSWQVPHYILYCYLFTVEYGILQNLIHVKVGLGISRTNADSQVYNAFHRNFGCGNETIHRQYCKRDLDAANLRPVLKQGCGKQTPSARKLFFRVNLLYVPKIKM